MAHWSLRWRLTVWYVSAMLAVVALFAGITLALVRRHVHARIDGELVEEARELAEELSFAKSTDEFRQRFALHYAEHGGFSFQVSRFDGTVLVGSPWLLAHHLPRPASPLDLASPHMQDWMLPRLGLQRVLFRTVRGPTESLLIHVVTPHAAAERELQTFAGVLFMGGALAVSAACAGGWLIARQALRLVDRMALAAERISAENLCELVPVDNPHDELGRLATTLNETFDRLRRSIDEIRRFTADAAHELRTPMAVMRTTLEVALRSDLNPEDLRNKTEVALAQATRLSTLIDQLLALSRLETRSPIQVMEEVSLSALLKDVVESIQPAANRKRVSLLVDELPDCIVFGDDVLLSRVFFNLLDNAIKFTPAGGVIRLSAEANESRMQVAVEDTGPGIDPIHWPHVFQRFYRVDQSRNPQVPGAGLGLAICKSIVVAHGGEITVGSEPGRGARFTVTLPVRLAAPPKWEQPPSRIAV